MPLDAAKTYNVVTNNFMRNGGDGYSVFKTKAENAYDYGPGLETVLADYLTANNPYKPKTDGRITEIAAATPAEPSTPDQHRHSREPPMPSRLRRKQRHRKPNRRQS